ncbi:response regulator [Compostibacter hankyongensis]|uniref:Response regulator n=1 Tax=Compostibacter hankyongensis TaxID=1007089 RepID=A0ABP8FWK0_9BACT
MKKILVIEDNKEVRENIAEILRLSDYEVITAENGKAGAEKALNEAPDLIICDIMMPVLDGYGVLHLLNRHKETAGKPFIFLTAKSERGDFRKGMEMGADDYITKPFDGIELLSAVESRLKKIASIRQEFRENAEGINQFIRQAGAAASIPLTSEEREVCEYKKKHALYAEGQRPKAVYYVIGGKIKTYRVNEDGKELITKIYGPGDFLGYSPILEGVNYKDNAAILEDAELMLIPAEDFINLISNDIQVSRAFIRLIARNIREQEENLLNLAYNSLRKKVAFGLVQLCEKFKQGEHAPVLLDISRENMAYAVGVATESFIRTLSDFKAEGLIEIRNGKVFVINEKKLNALPY